MKKKIICNARKPSRDVIKMGDHDNKNGVRSKMASQMIMSRRELVGALKPLQNYIKIGHLPN
jgi:hypothetical protein